MAHSMITKFAGIVAAGAAGLTLGVGTASARSVPPALARQVLAGAAAAPNLHAEEVYLSWSVRKLELEGYTVLTPSERRALSTDLRAIYAPGPDSFVKNAPCGAGWHTVIDAQGDFACAPGPAPTPAQVRRREAAAAAAAAAAAQQAQQQYQQYQQQAAQYEGTTGEPGYAFGTWAGGYTI